MQIINASYSGYGPNDIIIKDGITYKIIDIGVSYFPKLSFVCKNLTDLNGENVEIPL